jgi:hypothetical protein
MEVGFEGVADVTSETPHWWLSFCDPDRPRGEKFKHAVIVEGRDIVEAADEAWRLGINPGGEVMGYELPHRVAAHLVGRKIGGLEADCLTKMDADWPLEAAADE